MSAQYLYSLDNTQPMTLDIKTGASVTSGQLLTISSGLAIPATAASATILGICTKTAGSGEITRCLLLNDKSVVRLPFVGSTKKTLADADRFGTKFDLTSDQIVDLDDTTGGGAMVISYQNLSPTAGTGIADVVFSLTALWNK